MANPPARKPLTDPGEIFELSETKKIQISEFQDKILIDFREYYTRPDGGSGPTKKGMSLTVDLWEKFLGAIEDINQAIAKRQAKLQGQSNDEQAPTSGPGPNSVGGQ